MWKTRKRFRSWLCWRRDSVVDVLENGWENQYQFYKKQQRQPPPQSQEQPETILALTLEVIAQRNELMSLKFELARREDQHKEQLRSIHQIIEQLTYSNRAHLNNDITIQPPPLPPPPSPPPQQQQQIRRQPSNRSNTMSTSADIIHNARNSGNITGNVMLNQQQTQQQQQQQHQRKQQTKGHRISGRLSPMFNSTNKTQNQATTTGYRSDVSSVMPDDSDGSDIVTALSPLLSELVKSKKKAAKLEAKNSRMKRYTSRMQSKQNEGDGIIVKNDVVRRTMKNDLITRSATRSQSRSKRKSSAIDRKNKMQMSDPVMSKTSPMSDPVFPSKTTHN